MPRFFFHVHDGQDTIDHEGTELPSAQAAHDEAVATSGRMIAEKGGKVGSGDEWRMWVTDVTGAVVCDLKFSADC